MNTNKFVFYSLRTGLDFYKKTTGKDASYHYISNLTKIPTTTLFDIFNSKVTPTINQFLNIMRVLGYELTLDNWRPIPEGINPEFFD